MVSRSKADGKCVRLSVPLTSVSKSELTEPGCLGATKAFSATVCRCPSETCVSRQLLGLFRCRFFKCAALFFLTLGGRAATGEDETNVGRGGAGGVLESEGGRYRVLQVQLSQHLKYLFQP